MADSILKINGSSTDNTGALNLLGSDFISGLNMVWVSGTALTVTTGGACRPSDGLLLRPAANIAKTGLSLSASTIYHVYLWLNGSNPDIEIVTTAPAAPYFGTARAKTGDTSRRYIGSFATDSSGNIYQFTQYQLTTRYITAGGAPFRLVSNGVATARTNIDISLLVPLTSVTALVKAQNSSSAAQALIIDSAASGLTGTAGLVTIAQQSTQVIGDIPTLGSSNLQYLWSATPVTQGAFIDILGFTIQR